MDTGDKADVGNWDRLKSPLHRSRLWPMGFWRPPRERRVRLRERARRPDTGFPLCRAPAPGSDSMRLPLSHQLPEEALASHGGVGGARGGGVSLGPAGDLCPMALITKTKPPSCQGEEITGWVPGGLNKGDHPPSFPNHRWKGHCKSPKIIRK